MTAKRNPGTLRRMDTEAAAIGRVFDCWHIWESDSGLWWAARKATLTAAETGAGHAQYLQAATAGELCGQIEADEALAEGKA